MCSARAPGPALALADSSAQHRLDALAGPVTGLDALVSTRKTAQIIHNSSLCQWALSACSRLSRLQMEGNVSREFS